jgi:hypothetical protein
MPKGMEAIYSNSFSGGVGTLNFFNIPQTYTDLKIVVSQRNSSGNLYEPLAFRFDSGAGIYSSTAAFGDGSSAMSNRAANGGYLSYNGGLSVTGNNATANTFGIYEVYIPNYSGTGFKQFTIDAVTENNGGAAHCNMGAGLYSSNTPITFLQIGGYTGSPFTATSITIYGISR